MPIPSDAWTLVANNGQPRVARERLVARMDSSFRDPGSRDLKPGVQAGLGSGWWWDSVSGLLMLAPARLEPQWWTTNTGRWAKYGLSQLTVSGGTWTELATGGAGDIRLYGYGCAGATLTLPSQPANQALVVGAYAHEAGAAAYQLLRVQWPGSLSVTLDLDSDGTAALSVGSSVIAEGSLGGSSSSGGDGQGRWFDLILIPIRHRQLLVLCVSTGEGFVATRTDLPSGSGPQTVLPACQPVVTSLSPSAVLQIARLGFPASATAYSLETALAEPPYASGESAFQRAYWFASGASGESVTVSLAKPDGSAFVADGAAQSCRVRVDLAGGGWSTPQVQGAVAGYSRLIQQTDDDATDLLSGVSAVSVRVGEDGRSELAAELTDTAIVDPLWTSVASCAIGGRVIVEGDLAVERLEDGLVPRAAIRVRDPWAFAEEALFRDPAVFDGQPLSDALTFLGQSTGYQTEIGSGVPTMTLPEPTSEDWGLAARVGDSPADWLERIRDGFVPELVAGFRPTSAGYRWRADVVTAPVSVPDIQLWRTVEDARDWLISVGYTPAEAEERAPMYTVRRLTRTRVPPQANDVRAIGWDWQQSRPIVVYRRDSASATPGTSRDLRPSNWVGRTKPMGVFEPSLTSQSQVDVLCKRLYAILSRPRVLVEIECGCVLHQTTGVPLWRGDAVWVDGIGTCVVASLELRLERQDGSRGWKRASGVYRLEALGAGTAYAPLSDGWTLEEQMIGRLPTMRIKTVGPSTVAVMS
jgi:hypothetical protein